jgi:hypothetical protein
MAIDPIDPKERHVRIGQPIEKYRAAKQRRLLQRAMRLWRKTEARRQIVELDASPQLVH